jgi:hypothetical protein
MKFPTMHRVVQNGRFDSRNLRPKWGLLQGKTVDLIHIS